MAHRESHEASELREEIRELRDELKQARREGISAEIRSVKKALLNREKELSDALAAHSDGW